MKTISMRYRNLKNGKISIYYRGRCLATVRTMESARVYCAAFAGQDRRYTLTSIG